MSNVSTMTSLTSPLWDWTSPLKDNLSKFLEENVFQDTKVKASNSIGVGYLIVFILLGLIFLYNHVVSRRSKSENEKKGGKWKVPVVNRWLSLLSPLDMVYYFWRISKDGMGAWEEYNEKYGKVYKMDSYYIRHYIVSDVEIIQKVLGSPDPNYLNKPTFFRTLLDILGIKESVFSLDGTDWFNRRKMMNRSFTYKSIQSYLGTFNKNTRKMVEDIKCSLYVSGTGENEFYIKPKDLFDHQNLCTIKSAASIIMGAEITTNEENIQFREDFRNGKDLAVFRLFRPWLVSDLLFRLYPERQLWYKSLDGALQFILKLINTYKDEQDRLKSEGKLIKFMEKDLQEDNNIGLRPHRSMIEELLYAGLGEKEVVDEVVTFMIGGHETTMSTISAFMLHMALNPKEQGRCQEEIDILFESKAGQKFDLSMDDLSSLKHMERCFNEVLRLTTIIPIFNRRLDAPLKIDDDLTFEKGTNVMINMWSMHRNPEYFPDPLKFDPDRFLPENSKSRHKFAFIPFATGLRNCIAWKMATCHVKVVMFWILLNFEIRCKDPGLKFEDIKWMYELTIKTENDIDFIWKRRDVNYNYYEIIK